MAFQIIRNIERKQIHYEPAPESLDCYAGIQKDSYAYLYK